jgi:hypothetical protein
VFCATTGSANTAKAALSKLTLIPLFIKILSLLRYILDRLRPVAAQEEETR